MHGEWWKQNKLKDANTVKNSKRKRTILIFHVGFMIFFYQCRSGNMILTFHFLVLKKCHKMLINFPSCNPMQNIWLSLFSSLSFSLLQLYARQQKMLCVSFHCNANLRGFLSHYAIEIILWLGHFEISQT